MTTGKTFKEGATYSARIAGDHTMHMTMTVLRRTARTVLYLTDEGQAVKSRIREMDGVEFVLLGNYAKAPVFKASAEVA